MAHYNGHIEWLSAQEVVEFWNIDKETLKELITSRKFLPFKGHQGLLIFQVEGLDPDKALELLNSGPETLFFPSDNIVSYTALSLHEAKDHPHYAFRQTGPGWEIVWDGKPARGLRGKGFSYLHYLVKHEGKKINISELIRAVEGIELLFENSQSVADPRTLQKLKEEHSGLQKELTEAKKNNDLPRAAAAKMELDNVTKYFSKVSYNGKSKQFSNPISKAQNRIYKALVSTLKQIAKQFPAAEKHFRAALGKIDTPIYSYAPSKSIPWQLE